MLAFSITMRPRESPYRQVVYAATKAVVSGELKQGAPFPSVRELSQALKINPNTAQKVVAELIRDGTVVTSAPRASAAERRALLSREVEQLAVEAKRLGLKRSEVVNAVRARWAELFGGGDDE